MIDNRKLISEFLDVFDKNDTEAILKNLTDDVEWNILDDQKISGKEAAR